MRREVVLLLVLAVLTGFLIWLLPGTLRHFRALSTPAVPEAPGLESSTVEAGVWTQDAALSQAIEAQLADGRPLAAVRELHVAAAGIRTLAGLERFTGIETLILTTNQIASLRPLRHLPALKKADLRANPLHCDAQRRNLNSLRQRGVEILCDCPE